MRTVFTEMLPSISTSANSKSKQKLRKRWWLKVCTVILGLAVVSLLFATSYLLVQNNHQRIVRDIVYYEKHPKNINVVLDKKTYYYDSNLSYRDVHISVKTTLENHASRVGVILKTWFQNAKSMTYFVTDSPDKQLIDITGGRVVVSHCNASHSHGDLNCKMNAELDAFYNIQPMKKWFCHFDDDNYVNVDALMEKLRQFDHRQDWYLGRPSLPYPFEIDRRSPNLRDLKFWFATGGAGFCLSQSLATKMKPLTYGGKFKQVGEEIALPDDITIGYVVEHLLKVPLTALHEFHSHLEGLDKIPVEKFSSDISFSYSFKNNNVKEGRGNVVTIKGGFSAEEDPTRYFRFKSLHCLLYPEVNWCHKFY